MVAGLVLIIGLVGVAFVFRKDITNFLSGGITGIGDSLNDAFSNLGKDAEKFGTDTQKNFDQFVKETQQGIDKSVLETQGNINKFFTDAQKNFDANIEGISTGLNQGIVAQQNAIDKFGQEAQENIAKTAGGIQQGFTDFSSNVSQVFSNAFGGQSKPKDISKNVNSMTLNKTGQNVSRANRSQITSKPDILIMKDRPLTIESIKPDLQKNITQTKPQVSRFLTAFSNPSNTQESKTEVKENKPVPSVTSRRTALRNRGGFGR